MKKTLTLKLIETSEKPKIGDIVSNSNNQYRFHKELGRFRRGSDKTIKPILISDEEIESKDYILVNCSEAEVVNDIAQVYSVDKDRVFFEDGSNIGIEYCKKIEVNSEQIPTNILEAIVEGKLKDGDSVEVEYEGEPLYTSKGFLRGYNDKLKLDSNNKAICSIPLEDFEYVTAGDDYLRKKEVSKIMYSEEEVENLISKLMNQVCTGDLTVIYKSTDFNLSPRQWLIKYGK